MKTSRSTKKSDHMVGYQHIDKHGGIGLNIDTTKRFGMCSGTPLKSFYNSVANLFEASEYIRRVCSCDFETAFNMIRSGKIPTSLIALFMEG